MKAVNLKNFETKDNKKIIQSAFDSSKAPDFCWKASG